MFLCLAAFLVMAVSVGAQSRSYPLDRGAKAYMDSIKWSNNHGIGTGGYICSLRAAADIDTSASFTLSNIQNMGAMFLWDTRQGTAGGTHAVSCSLAVSIDGSNWMTATGIPLWSTAVSADPTEASIVVFASDQDSAVTATDIPGPRGNALIRACRLGRFVCAQASGAADSTLLKVFLYRQYRFLGGNP